MVTRGGFFACIHGSLSTETTKASVFGRPNFRFWTPRITKPRAFFLYADLVRDELVFRWVTTGQSSMLYISFLFLFDFSYSDIISVRLR